MGDLRALRADSMLCRYISRRRHQWMRWQMRAVRRALLLTWHATRRHGRQWMRGQVRTLRHDLMLARLNTRGHGWQWMRWQVCLKSTPEIFTGNPIQYYCFFLVCDRFRRTGVFDWATW